MGDLNERSKVNLDLESYVYIHFLIMLNKSSEYNDFGFNSFQKKYTFKNVSYLSALGIKEFLAIRRAISLNETFVLFC